MPRTEKLMRRLSVFFVNGEAMTLELTADDLWDDIKLEVMRSNGEVIRFIAGALAYTRLLPYVVVDDPGPKVRPVRAPDPELDLR
jgi:hypothetical protein